jgi:FkbM family methyltransferase
MSSYLGRMHTALSHPSIVVDYAKYMLWRNSSGTAWGGRLWASSYSEFRTARNLALTGDEIALLEMTNSEGHFFDVGAHIGIWTIPIALSRPRAVVHAFEASPSTFQRLETNITKNKINNVNAVNAAVFDSAGSVTFQAPRNASVFGRIYSPSNSRARYNDVIEVSVPSLTIDQYCCDRKIEQIELLKIDVEGAEWHVLKGCSMMLSKKKVRFLWIELDDGNQLDFGCSVDNIAGLLDDMGYAFYRLADLTTAMDIRNKRDPNMLAFAFDPGELSGEPRRHNQGATTP